MYFLKNVRKKWQELVDGAWFYLGILADLAPADFFFLDNDEGAAGWLHSASRPQESFKTAWELQDFRRAPRPQEMINDNDNETFISGDTIE